MVGGGGPSVVVLGLRSGVRDSCRADWEQELYQRLRCVSGGDRAVQPSVDGVEVVLRRGHPGTLVGQGVVPGADRWLPVDGLLSAQQVIDLEPVGRGVRAATPGPAERRGRSDDVFDWDATRPPYPGLLAFAGADAGVFFGPDRGDRCGARPVEPGASVGLTRSRGGGRRVGVGEVVTRAGRAGASAATGHGAMAGGGSVSVPAMTRWRSWLRCGPACSARSAKPRNHVEIAAELCASDSTVANPLVSLSSELRRAANRSKRRSCSSSISSRSCSTRHRRRRRDVLKPLAGPARRRAALGAGDPCGRISLAHSRPSSTARVAVRADAGRADVGRDVAQIIEGPAASGGLAARVGPGLGDVG